MQYYRYDPHVHTSEVSGCGKLTAAEMVEGYEQHHYQGIIITDHYYSGFVERERCSWDETVDRYLAGYRNAVQAAGNRDMDILLGMEIRFDGTNEDYLVIGFEEDFLYRNPFLNRLSLESFHGLIQGSGILIIQAHPFRPGLTPADPRLLDGVEAFNGNPRHESQNEKAYAYGRENNLLLLSGSDAHQPQDIGNGGIGLYERVRSAGELVRLLREKAPLDMIHRW